METVALGALMGGEQNSILPVETEATITCTVETLGD